MQAERAARLCHANASDLQSRKEEILGKTPFPMEAGLCSVKTPMASEVTAFASKHLIDIYLLEHLIRLTGMADPGFGAKECSSLVLASWMFDILIRQFFSLQEQQHATFQNVPLGDFHRKVFTEVALDVILTELNKVAEEDMEDLLEYERGVHTASCKAKQLMHLP